MKVMVTGSRDWTDYERVVKVLQSYEYQARHHGSEPKMTLFHGACPYGGLDAIAAEIAEKLGWEVIPFPPASKRAADLKARNQAMVDAKPDVCLAFPLIGSRGTWDALNRAKKAGIRSQTIRG